MTVEISVCTNILAGYCISALRVYLPKEEVTAGFFNLIRIWWKFSIISKQGGAYTDL